jgi:hypothetical protein
MRSRASHPVLSMARTCSLGGPEAGVCLDPLARSVAFGRPVNRPTLVVQGTSLARNRKREIAVPRRYRRPGTASQCAGGLREIDRLARAIGPGAKPLHSRAARFLARCPLEKVELQLQSRQRRAKLVRDRDSRRAPGQRPGRNARSLRRGRQCLLPAPRAGFWPTGRNRRAAPRGHRPAIGRSLRARWPRPRARTRGRPPGTRRIRPARPGGR